ncbi:MAG: N-acetyl-gamma-glutamyl-phosphate reductase, partial [Candidatus Latescibacterota bacterium]
MGKARVFIDGQEGTTGLRIRHMLDGRDDVDVLLIPPADRKNAAARADYLNQVDVAILCLPDDAAAEALELIDNPA